MTSADAASDDGLAERTDLRLTRRERETFAAGQFLPRSVDARLAAPGTANVMCFSLTGGELRAVHRAVEDVLPAARAPHARRLATVLRRVEAALAWRRQTAERHAAAVARNRPPEPGRVPGLVFQFRVALDGIDRPVWRTFRLEDADLFTLDYLLELVMVWTGGGRLHRFDIGGRAYGPRLTWDHEVVTEGDWADERGVFLHDLFGDGKAAAGAWAYDLSAGWVHTLTLEGVVSWDFEVDYPVCVGGAGACPPDASGGPAAYNSYLAVEAPLPDVVGRHRGDRRPFDPAAFDAAAVNDSLAEWGYQLHLREQGWWGGRGRRAARG